MTTNAPRAPIDFDAFERDLRQAARPEAPAPKADPLAELARIVGQDDPFRALLESRQTQESARAAGPAPRHDGIGSGFDDPLLHPGSDREAIQASLSPADAFDQYLASVEQEAYAADADEPRHEDFAAVAPGGGKRSYRDMLATRPRRQLVRVGAGLGVLIVCVTGALVWKSLGTAGSDGPVTVLADKTPLKVAPEVAGGVEIPDQNKQIYERNAKEDRIKVVNREEQPLDVAQAARTASQDGGRGGTTPGHGAMLTESLGEPRRVRTVAVKPDTPPPALPPQAEAAREVGQAPSSPIPTMTMPSEDTATPPAAPPRRPSRTLASTAASSPAASASPSASTPSSAETPAAEPTAPAPRKAVQRVASVAPETTASTAEEPAAATPAVTASVGGYAVQLGVRNSEADARAAFKQMQSKYAQLSGKPELIRQVEIDGKTIYRVRVGPLAKNEANGLCTELKGAGGQCFVAKN